jgi:hypothetical protein
MFFFFTPTTFDVQHSNSRCQRFRHFPFITGGAPHSTLITRITFFCAYPLLREYWLILPFGEEKKKKQTKAYTISL